MDIQALTQYFLQYGAVFIFVIVLLEYLKESLRKNRQISAGIDSASAGEAGAPEKEKTAGRLAQLAKEGQLLEQLIGIMK